MVSELCQLIQPFSRASVMLPISCVDCGLGVFITVPRAWNHLKPSETPRDMINHLSPINHTKSHMPRPWVKTVKTLTSSSPKSLAQLDVSQRWSCSYCPQSEAIHVSFVKSSNKIGWNVPFDQRSNHSDPISSSLIHYMIICSYFIT